MSGIVSRVKFLKSFFLIFLSDKFNEFKLGLISVYLCNSMQ